jgi:hypothetical protein
MDRHTIRIWNNHYNIIDMYENKARGDDSMIETYSLEEKRAGCAGCNSGSLHSSIEYGGMGKSHHSG